MLFGSFFLCALAILFFPPLFGQENASQNNVIQRVTGPIQSATAPITGPIQSAAAPIAGQIQSVFSHSPQPSRPRGERVNSALPGFGTQPREHNDQRVPPPVFAGSLELLGVVPLPHETTYVPAIYVAEQGYVPLAHSSIQPHIDPALLANPESSPAVVMIPMSISPTPSPALEAKTIMFPTGEKVTQTQFISSTAIPQLPEMADLGFRQVGLFPRGDTPFGLAIDFYDRNDPARGGIVALTGGINVVIEGITHEDALAILAGDTIDISADNAVIWTENPGQLASGASYVESGNVDFEIYLEGNIIYRDGPRVIHADRMYYDVKHQIGYIENGHLVAPIGDISGMEGSIRLRADILRQMGDGVFTARNTMVTTSQLGEPAYSLRSQTLRFNQRGALPFEGSGARPRQMVVAENNYVAIRNVPVFYWPWIATDVENPTFYLRNFSYGTSGRNGHAIRTLWDPFQILNVRRPDGVNGDVHVGWIEKRGVNYGTSFRYDLPRSQPLSDSTKGSFVYWGIHDKGTDRLGGERSDVEFPNQYRYRIHWLHQQRGDFTLPLLGGPWDLRAEIGKVSDRNLLNSYFNSAWHTEENATTAIDLKRRQGNSSLGLSAEYALDSHYSNANWLPRFDHFRLGESLFSDYVTWYGRTRVGLVNYRAAKEPYDTTDSDFFEYLPWEETAHGRTGLAFSTRHKFDLPVQAGAFKIVPYVLGDASHWGEDQLGNSVNRVYGQTGVRLNLPIWRVNPRVASRMWYVNGLAHKIDLNAEYMYAQANRRMDGLILTDPLDQWSIDDFRRRYIMHSHFGGNMPERFDPRFYALRSGMASNVTAGNMEIADDMQMLRMGMTHRFQTKRGSVGNRRILDWITLSTHMNFYPESRHNFGEHIGLLDYHALWHVGDRFSLFSEGLYDFFSSGQKLTRFGGVWNRPHRGNFSLSVDQFSGIVERTYLSMSIGYTMSEKYSVSYATSYDLRDGQNVGHNFMLIRSGESFRLLVGAAYSEALSEWSFSVGLEPVFLRRSAHTSRVGGMF